MRTILKSTLTLLLFIFLAGTLSAQSEGRPVYKYFDVGFELQAYPTGVIPGIRLEKYLNSFSSVSFRLGYQLIDHRDLGVQENEEGSGYGGSIAYRTFFGSCHRGLSLAVRGDLWFNKIDWENEMNTGTSNITVIQPTLMGEYAFRPNKSISITPSLSFGWEWNVHTDGEPTGEGSILLVGCTIGIGL